MPENINPVGWFEIPVSDFNRAKSFYSAVFGYEFETQDMGSTKMAIFPMTSEKDGTSGALVFNEEFYKPSMDGTLIYFTAFSGDLQNELDKVEPAGGKVLMPKKQISEDHGYMGLFLDSEGNRVALHSRG